MFLGMVLASITHPSLTKLVGKYDDDEPDKVYQKYDVIGYVGLFFIWLAMTVPIYNFFVYIGLKKKNRDESNVK
jgi:hypothetical protein